MCRKRPTGRMASLYWSKWSGDGDREAWKQRFDKACYQDVATEWLDSARASWDADGAFTCLLCDATDLGDLTEIYATIFVPGEAADRFRVVACLKHLPDVLKRAKVGADTLPERDPNVLSGARATGW
jgi:hypothetical protein